jgi:hypothetical protein
MCLCAGLGNLPEYTRPPSTVRSSNSAGDGLPETSIVFASVREYGKIFLHQNSAQTSSLQTSVPESITIIYCERKELYDFKRSKQFKRLKASGKLQRKDNNFRKILLCAALVSRYRLDTYLANPPLCASMTRAKKLRPINQFRPQIMIKSQPVISDTTHKMNTSLERSRSNHRISNPLLFGCYKSV